jgi:TPR repeat protein
MCLGYLFFAHVKDLIELIPDEGGSRYPMYQNKITRVFLSEEDKVFYAKVDEYFKELKVEVDAYWEKYKRRDEAPRFITMEEITEEELAELNAELDEMEVRYEANSKGNSIGGIFYLSTFLQYKYFLNKYGHVMKEELVRQRADNGSMFALSNFYYYGSLELEGVIAAEKGEVNAMGTVGHFMYRGHDRDISKDEEKGDEYLRRAADLGDYIIIELYLDNRDNIDTEVLCYYARKSYSDYETGGFSYFLRERPNDILYLQNTCKLFNNKEYTLMQIPLALIEDMQEDEYFKMEKATFYSEREPIISKQIFEELEKSEDIRLVSTAQYCLFRQHYLGVGVPRDFDKALEYLKKAHQNGNEFANNSITNLERRHGLALDVLPKVHRLTDYTGTDGASCFHNISGIYSGIIKMSKIADQEMNEFYK